MEPITLIMAALIAGSAAGVQSVASETIRDAYHALKGAILRRFGDRPEVAVTLEKAEQKPDVWSEPLKEILQEVGADREQEIVAAAAELMRLAGPEVAQVGKYNLQIKGNVQGLAAGDNQHVQITFRSDG